MFILVQGQEFYHFNTRYLQSQDYRLKTKNVNLSYFENRNSCFFFSSEALELIRIDKTRLRVL